MPYLNLGYISSIGLTIILFIHVLSAIIFVGGSIFIWVILWPESYKLNDEKLRTRLLGLVGKKFALYTNISLSLLIITGLAMTQDDLAKKIFERKNVLSNIERGELMPNISTAKKLEKILDVKLIERE